MADQLGKSVGDMYKGAFVPGFVLAGLYLGYVLGCTVFKPQWAPALPPEARVFREPSGKSGVTSLLALTVISVAGALAFARFYLAADRALDEVIVITLLVGIGIAFVLAMISRMLKLDLLSAMAQKVTFVLIPPLALIFLVLGTIFLGVATPTEGGAMGAIRRGADGAGAQAPVVVAAQAGDGQHGQADDVRRVHPGRRAGVQPDVLRRRRPQVGRAPAHRACPAARSAS